MSKRVISFYETKVSCINDINPNVRGGWIYLHPPLAQFVDGKIHKLLPKCD